MTKRDLECTRRKALAALAGLAGTSLVGCGSTNGGTGSSDAGRSDAGGSDVTVQVSTPWRRRRRHAQPVSARRRPAASSDQAGAPGCERQGVGARG
jgi:hypothetical protein